MAALALSIVGSAAGGAVFGPTGAIAGRLIGTLADNVIDQVLFGAANACLARPSFLRATMSTLGH